MKTYRVWNPAKMHYLDLPEDTTYNELINAEKVLMTSISSFIETDDIDPLIVAIHNETDVKLSYHEASQ